MKVQELDRDTIAIKHIEGIEIHSPPGTKLMMIENTASLNDQDCSEMIAPVWDIRYHVMPDRSRIFVIESSIIIVPEDPAKDSSTFHYDQTFINNDRLVAWDREGLIHVYDSGTVYYYSPNEALMKSKECRIPSGSAEQGERQMAYKCRMHTESSLFALNAQGCVLVCLRPGSSEPEAYIVPDHSPYMMENQIFFVPDRKEAVVLERIEDRFEYLLLTHDSFTYWRSEMNGRLIADLETHRTHSKGRYRVDPYIPGTIIVLDHETRAVNVGNEWWITSDTVGLVAKISMPGVTTDNMMIEERSGVCLVTDEPILTFQPFNPVHYHRRSFRIGGNAPTFIAKIVFADRMMLFWIEDQGIFSAHFIGCDYRSYLCQDNTIFWSDKGKRFLIRLGDWELLGRQPGEMLQMTTIAGPKKSLFYPHTSISVRNIEEGKIFVIRPELGLIDSYIEPGPSSRFSVSSKRFPIQNVIYPVPGTRKIILRDRLGRSWICGNRNTVPVLVGKNVTWIFSSPEDSVAEVVKIGLSGRETNRVETNDWQPFRPDRGFPPPHIPQKEDDSPSDEHNTPFLYDDSPPQESDTSPPRGKDTSSDTSSDTSQDPWDSPPPGYIW